MLKFSSVKGNAKLRWLGTGAYTFSLLSGHSCVFANECLAKVVETETSRKMVDGPNQVFRCFSASNELIYKNTYEQRKHNLELLRTVAHSKPKMVELIKKSLPKDLKILRLHVAGDFFTQSYFDAWLEVMAKTPHIHYYAYTKSLIFWVRCLDSIPENFILTASRGGLSDTLIEKHNLRFAQVVGSEYEARKLKLPVDTTDKYAMLPKHRNTSFALIVHGMQKAGGKFSKNWKAQIDGKRKFHGYNKETAMKT
jgi:hypothetical protein